MVDQLIIFHKPNKKASYIPQIKEESKLYSSNQTNQIRKQVIFHKSNKKASYIPQTKQTK
jgi:hypothetical protein